MLRGERACNFYCSTILKQTSCCDGIFLPSFYFKNAYSFSADQQVLVCLLGWQQMHAGATVGSCRLLLPCCVPGVVGTDRLPASQQHRHYDFFLPPSLPPQCILPQTYDAGTWFNEFSETSSASGDPMPLSPAAVVQAS